MPLLHDKAYRVDGQTYPRHTIPVPLGIIGLVTVVRMICRTIAAIGLPLGTVILWYLPDAHAHRVKHREYSS